MMSRCRSLGGVIGRAGTSREPLIDQAIPSIARPNGAPASAEPAELPARAGDAPTGTWNTIQGIAAAISRTAECVANRGAAYFSDGPLFRFLMAALLRLTSDKLPSLTMACVAATSYHTTVTWPLPPARNHFRSSTQRCRRKDCGADRN